MLHHFILASRSPYRRDLLKKILPNFDCLAPNIDETPKNNETVAQLVARLSRQKAEAIAKLHPNSWVIASDQSASLAGKPLGKAHNFTQALLQLEQQQGKTVTYHTGICLYNPATKAFNYLDEPTEVIFRQLNTESLSRYLIQEQPYDCAGSFKSEGIGILLFSAIKSHDPNALIGLPLIKLCRLLSEAGLDLPLKP